MTELEELAFRTRLPSKTASPDSPIFQLDNWILLRFVWEALQFPETGKSKATMSATQGVQRLSIPRAFRGPAAYCLGATGARKSLWVVLVCSPLM